MSAERILSPEDCILMQLVLMDPVVIDQFIDHNKLELFKSRDIDRTNGSIVFGKTKIRWLNHFIGDEVKIDFLTFALKAISAISGQQNNYNERILSALTKEVVTNAVMKKDYSFVIHRLFDAFHYGCKSYTGAKDNSPDNNNENAVQEQLAAIRNQLKSRTYSIGLNSGESIGLLKLIFNNN